jgi:hypothetical protein
MGAMSKTIELVEQYDIDPEVIEALLLRYGNASFDDTTKDEIKGEEKVVYQFLESDGDHPIRLAEDHYYQFERSDVADSSSAPSSEAEFKKVLETLVAKGVVARTDDKRPRYSTSFYDLLADIKRNFTTSEIDSLCESTGMSKRQVYYHILTDLDLSVDLTT